MNDIGIFSIRYCQVIHKFKNGDYEVTDVMYGDEQNLF